MAGTKRNNCNFWPLAHKFLGSYLSNVRNLSPNTVDAYKQSLKDFIDYLEQRFGLYYTQISIRQHHGRRCLEHTPETSTSQNKN